MAHDHHFLSRLDRVASAEVELALSLYRDHALIREVLSHAKLPDGAERVAISLGHPEEGPFIVVARDGGFVTCLGRGMSPGALPMVTRSKLDAISSRIEKLREGLRLAYSLTGGHFDKLLARIVRAGPMLSREEATALIAIKPLLTKGLTPLLFECASEVHHARILLRNVEKPHLREGRRLRRAWGHLFAIGHLAVLLGVDGREHFDAVDEDERWLRDQFMQFAFQQCVFAISIRGVWAASKMGKALLPTMKGRLAKANSFVDTVASAAALNAIAYGHSRLRAEATRALALPDVPVTDLRTETINLVRAGFRELLAETAAGADEAEAVALSWGRAAACQWMSQAPASSGHRYEREEDVPDDIAKMFASWHFGNTGQENADIEEVIKLTPWIVKQRAEDFFLPAELLISTRFPELSPMAHEIIQRPFQAYWLSVPKPAQAAKVPGRNEPCYCGSGKKYKRCCAR